MERLIEIPVTVMHDIGEIYSHYGISEYKTGDIYLFDPNHSMDVELDDSGFFEQIENSKCDFYCNEPIMELGGVSYGQDEMIKDLSQVSEEAVNCLVLLGRLRKVYAQKPVKEPIKSAPKKNNKPKYSDIAKALNLSFSELKKKAQAIDIEIKKASDKLSKKKMTEIIGTLSK